MPGPKGLTKSVSLKICDMKTLATADCEYVKISSISVLDIKFWMKEDD